MKEVTNLEKKIILSDISIKYLTNFQLCNLS